MPDIQNSDDRRTPRSGGKPPLDRVFVVRVLFLLAMLGLAAAIVKLSSLFLMVAGAIIVAVIIRLIADPLHKRLKVGETMSVVISVLAIIAFLLMAGTLFGTQVAAQVDTLIEALPSAVEEIRTDIASTALGDILSEAWSNAGQQAGAAFSYLRNLVGDVVSSVVSLVVVIVSGIIFATAPTTYRDGLLSLFPTPRRQRLREVMNASGIELKGWLVGQLISMTLIGVLTSIGLLLVGVPSWLVLGLLAGFAQFVPLLGPIISAVPGLVIAASMGWGPLAWTLLVYVGVQQIESNLLTPYVMSRMTSLPMVLVLFSIIAFTSIFGPIGALVATPITVVLFIGVKMLYVEDQLGDKAIAGSSGAVSAKSSN